MGIRWTRQEKGFLAHIASKFVHTEADELGEEDLKNLHTWAVFSLLEELLDDVVGVGTFTKTVTMVNAVFYDEGEIDILIDS